MKTFPRIGTAIATIMALAFALVMFARLQRMDVSAADPPRPNSGSSETGFVGRNGTFKERLANSSAKQQSQRAEQAAEQPTGKARSIIAELHALREDVRVLRLDVSRLIDILEARDGTSLKALPAGDDHSSNTSADADEEEPSFKEHWDVTLDQVISMGLQNSKAIRDLGGVTPCEFDGQKEVVLSRVNKDVSLADFETSVRNCVSDTEAAYWGLWAAQCHLDTAKKSRDAAKVLWNEVYEREKGGKADPQDESQAREQYFFFRDQVQSAQQELYRHEAILRFLLGVTTSDGRLMRVADEPTTNECTIDWDAAKESALSNSVQLRQQRRVVRQAELELVSAKASLQSQLDIARRDRWTTGEATEIELEKAKASEFGFDFQIPVGYRRAAAGVRNATFVVAREKARLEVMEKNSVYLLTKATREMGSFYQTTKTHLNRSLAAEAETESVNTLYKSGKTTLDLVLDAQRRLAQSKIDYTTALAQYMTAIKDVHDCQGSLLAEHNLVIETAAEPVSAAQETEDELAPRSAALPDPTVELKPGDRLTIESLTDDSLDRHVTIFPDGTVTLPLLGQVATAGHTLPQAQEQIKSLYGKFYRAPAISLSFYGTCVRVADAGASGWAFAQLENVPDPTADLKPGDQLLMESMVDPILNRRLTILGDGSITLPLLGQIQAAGRTLLELKEELEAHYQGHYKLPSLTLSFAGTSLPAHQ